MNGVLIESNLNESIFMVQDPSGEVPQISGVPHISLAVSLPKGNRSDWIVEKATECGVTEIIPLESARSVKVLKDDSKLYARWERMIEQASKQSFCAVMPKMRQSVKWKQLMKEADSYDSIIWGCMPYHDEFRPIPITQYLSNKKKSDMKRVLLLIGPEGDFTKDEQKELLSKSATPVVLSNNRLRTETAAITLIALITTHLNLD
eukprot:TRINITY_DN4841_c0_g1_i2.p1 TRINITY_DN4841_c0_g1~~TRINITY_DN4841_c0_g1_i2.p1  ORF type:complete len:205 (+),score=31.93 TRINITY_DN4841_c0_g1_i2:304-918(+)